MIDRSAPTTDTPSPGSPQWWFDRRVEPSTPQRGRPRRSIEEIIDAATQLVDESGQDGFSMRGLAERLETSTATLYRHVAGRGEVMVLVVERFLERLSLDAPSTVNAAASWKHAARDAAIQFRRSLSEHPNLIPLLVAGIPIGPNGLAMRERVIGGLVLYGFPADLAARTYTTLVHHVIGFAAQELAPGAPGDDEIKALRHYYRSLDPQRYPSTVASADALTTVAADDEFVEGLNYLLDGIDHALTRHEAAP